MRVTALPFLTILFFAYANGANINFKGVAALYGCVLTLRVAVAIGALSYVRWPFLVN